MNTEVGRWWNALGVGSCIVALALATAGLVAYASYDRDREAACLARGGKLVAVGQSPYGCYKVTYEPVAIESVR